MCRALCEGLQEIKQVRQILVGMGEGAQMDEKPGIRKLVKMRLTGALFIIRMNMWVSVLRINKNGK